MKRLFFILLLSIALVGCEKQPIKEEIFYELTLPSEVTSNQEDNSKIKANELVVLMISIPENKQLTSLKINSEEHRDLLDNDKLAFEITSDTVVSIKLEDKEVIVDPPIIKYYSLNLPEDITSDQADNTKIKENTEVFLTIHNPSSEVASFKVNGIEKVSELIDDTYTFIIIKDTTITIEYITVIPPEEIEYYAVYINLDGFPRYIYDEAKQRGVIPNLVYYGGEGMFFDNLQTIFPAVTNAVQAAIISGAHSNQTTNVISYFDKTQNKVIDQGRTNLAPTFYQVAAEQGITMASVRHYPAYPDPLSTTDLNKLYINVPTGETATGELRFDQALKALRLEPFTSNNTTLQLTSIPRLFTIYADDLDAVGHNSSSYGNSPALSLEGRIDNVINALAKLDAKIGEVVEVYKQAGIYDKTVFAITTDHGMAPYGAYTIGDSYGNSKLPDLKSKIESINPSYKFENLQNGQSPSPGTTIVSVGDNLQKGLTFIGITPTIQELIDIQTILEQEPYIYKVFNKVELIRQQIWRGANLDLMVVASERYHFANTAKYFSATHDTYLPESRHVFGIIFGGPVKQEVVLEETLNISFGKVIADALGIDLGLKANAPKIEFLKEEP